MGSSSIKINSISIDLAGASNEIDMVKCDHFSIRGFVAEARERDDRKSWPFSKESVSLMDQQSYALPSLLVPNFRWWRCMNCIKDIDVDGVKDCGLHSNSSRTIVINKKHDGNKLSSLTVIEQEKENKTDFAGNAIDEDVNCERSHKDNDTFLKNASTVIRSKSRKVTSPEQVGNKRSKEKLNVNQHQAFLSSEIAGVLEDPQPKAIKNHKGSRVLMESDTVSSESVSGLQRRKTRKVRLLSELLGKANTNKTSGGSSSGNVSKEDHQSGSKRDSVRGRKRKSDESNYVSRILSTMGATSENASKSCDSDTESTDSGFDRDPIRGKHRNRRFQVVDEFLPSLPCQTSQEGINEIDPAALSSPMQSLVNGKDSVTCPLTTQRTEKKLGLAKKKKRNKPVIDHNVKNSTLISFGAGMVEGQSGSSINAVSQSTRDLLDSRLASEGYFRKSVPQLNNDKRSPVISLHLQDNDHVRSKDAQANTGGWLRTGLDIFDFSSSSSDNNNNNNRSSFAHFKLRHTPSSTEVADLSSVQQKDASSSADKKGKTVIVEAPSRKENTPEEQNDDIPMEIVELMAKNQYERCLPDKEVDVSNKETAHKSKNALMIDLNETYDNGISMEEINTSRPQQEQQQQQPLCGSNARKEENFPQHKSHEFFPITQPYVPSSPFGIFPPTQENQASSIQFSGHNCQWLGNVPTMSNQNPSRVLRACNTCQSVPNQYPEASRPIWPPQGYRRPVSFNMDQPKTPGMLSSNGNTWNLNFVSTNGKQNSASNSEFSFGCKHAAPAATGANSHNRSIDVFSNESSIPALHLLSLMDPRLRSMTPADHNGNTKFTKRHFPPANQSTELQTGDSSKTAFSTKQLPFDLYSKRFAPETSRKSFPVIPPSSLSFQNAQASWNHHHQDKNNKRKDAFLPPVFPNNDEQRKFQLLGASNSMMLPLKFHMTDKEKRKADNCYNNNNNNASGWPRKSGSGPPIVCSVNRNPADFTIPEPGNVYMLTGENLKVRKRGTFKKKQPNFCKQDALKQSKKPVCPVTENA